MNTPQIKRLYNVVFVAVTLFLFLVSFRNVSGFVDDTVGYNLRSSLREEELRIDIELYNRILATEGLAAATNYKRTPKAAMHTGVLDFYEDHQNLLVFVMLVVVLALAYFVVWCGLTRLYGYIRFGTKVERDVEPIGDSPGARQAYIRFGTKIEPGNPPDSGPAAPPGNREVTNGPPSEK